MDQDSMRAHVHPRFPALIDAVMINHRKTDRTRRASPMAPSMEECLQRGDDPNQRDGQEFENTSLHWAAILDHADAIELLLHSKAVLGVQNNIGNTPLHEASTRGCIHALAVLLKAGADEGVKNNLGRTAKADAELTGYAGVYADAVIMAKGVESQAGSSDSSAAQSAWKPASPLNPSLRKADSARACVCFIC